MALRKFLGGIVLLAAAGAGAFYFITAPQRLPAQTWATAGEPDLANGEGIFNAGGCASCHAAPGAGRSGSRPGRRREFDAIIRGGPSVPGIGG